MTTVESTWPEFCRRCYNAPCRCFPPAAATPLGWKCPECARVNAPHIDACPCSPSLGKDYCKETTA